MADELVGDRARVADLSLQGALNTVTYRRFLTEAVEALSALDGAVYAVPQPGALELVAAHRDLGLWEREGRHYQIASRWLAGRHPLSAARVPAPGSPPPGRDGTYLCQPLYSGGRLCGALVVSGIPAMAPPAELVRLGHLPELIALTLEHERVSTALWQRAEDVRQLREQVEGFAMDFRTAYQAERHRARELADALGALEKTYRETVSVLALAVGAKDPYTGGHLHRVRRYGMMLTALIAPDHADDPQFEYGFLLHDIGKLSVPDAVLNKVGPLGPDEWSLIKDHPARGASMLDGLHFLDGAREVVLCHHERWDGHGYPQGLGGLDIPLAARLFPLCDAFDAMTSARVYRTVMSVSEAKAEVRRGSNSQFWPLAVEAFCSIPEDELYAVAQEATGPDGWKKAAVTSAFVG